MVGSTLGVYIFGLIFVSARTNKRHHHHRIDKQVSTFQLILTTWVLMEYKVQSISRSVLCLEFLVSGLVSKFESICRCLETVIMAIP